MVEERVVYAKESAWSKTRMKVRRLWEVIRRLRWPLMLWNILLCRLSVRLHTARSLGKPYFLMIEPSALCNLRCPLCPTGAGTLERKAGNMTFATFRRVIDDLAGALMEIVFTNYGEPYLNPDLNRMIRYAKARGVTVIVGTNGHFFQSDSAVAEVLESGVDRLYVSLDGACQATFERYRVRGDFERVVEGLKRLLAARRQRGQQTPVVELQFLVMRHNEHEVDAMRALAQAIGVDRLVLKAVSFNNADWHRPEVLRRFLEFVPADPDYRLYEVDGDQLRWLRPIDEPCDYLWRAAVVLWDGRIVPCCLDPRAEMVMGHVEEGFRRVWNNAHYRRLRRGVVRDKRSIPLCANCPGMT